jgi:hypothetical protein
MLAGAVVRLITLIQAQLAVQAKRVEQMVVI